MKTPKIIKIEINLVPGKMTPAAQEAWNLLWNKTVEITAVRKQPLAAGAAENLQDFGKGGWDESHDATQQSTHE
jgi:hypothetical protein